MGRRPSAPPSGVFRACRRGRPIALDSPGMDTTRKLAATLLLWTACALATAQTLRWASQGDIQTLDPHSQNEQLTNGINAQVYESLIKRDRQLGLAPALA